jgi:hypothetical protein
MDGVFCRKGRLPACIWVACIWEACIWAAEVFWPRCRLSRCFAFCWVLRCADCFWVWAWVWAWVWDAPRRSRLWVLLAWDRTALECWDLLVVEEALLPECCCDPDLLTRDPAARDPELLCDPVVRDSVVRDLAPLSEKDWDWEARLLLDDVLEEDLAAGFVALLERARVVEALVERELDALALVARVRFPVLFFCEGLLSRGWYSVLMSILTCYSVFAACFAALRRRAASNI